MWGHEGVPRRIDLLAQAVADTWSPAQLADLDIAYEATLGPAFDPLQMAGQLAAEAATGDAAPIGAEDLALQIIKGDIVVLDVSRKSDWPSDALRIPLESLRERLSEVPKDKLVVAVSQTGQRAYQAYRILKQRGFDIVRHLDGGALAYELTAD